jgi:hypothetical protein
VKITCVTANNLDIENVMKPILPNADYYHFNNNYTLSKWNNTQFRSFKRGGTTGNPEFYVNKYSGAPTNLEHNIGTFSAYTLSLLNNKIENFFKY